MTKVNGGPSVDHRDRRMTAKQRDVLDSATCAAYCRANI
jgi:hypothetical protein